MDIKKIKSLVEFSYKNHSLDEKKVKKIISLLKRSELKQYINEIKAKEQRKNALVTLPYYPSKEEQKKVQNLFPGKKIIYIVDPSLIVGIKVVNNDLVSEFSLKDALESLVDQQVKNYD